MTFFFNGLIDNLGNEHGNRGLDHLGMNRIVRMETPDFLDPVDVRIFPVIYYKIQQRQRLKQGDPALRGTATHAIYDIALQTKLIGENSDDDRSLAVTRKPEDNTFRFV